MKKWSGGCAKATKIRIRCSTQFLTLTYKLVIGQTSSTHLTACTASTSPQILVMLIKLTILVMVMALVLCQVDNISRIVKSRLDKRLVFQRENAIHSSWR